MGLLDKMKKRRAYSVDLGDGDTVHVRALSIGELGDLGDMPAELRTAFVLGCALCDDKGKPAFERQQDEDGKAFAKRMQSETAEFSTETIKECTQALAKIGKVPTDEDLAGN